MNLRLTRVLKVFLYSLLVGVSATYASNQVVVDSPYKQIVVEIDYGEGKPFRTIEHVFKDGDTALEVLQAVADVETHIVDIHNMVVAVDGVKGVRGEMAWYYQVDGEPAKQVAATFVVDGTKSIKWIYKTDVCSRTVDKQAIRPVM